MIRARHLVVGLCAAWLCLGVQAQAKRCTDARTGKVAYTDGVCNSGEAAHEVKIRPSPEEVLRYQQLYAEAPEHSRPRLQADNAAARSDAQRAVDLQRAFADYAPRRYDYARSPGCAGSRSAYDLLRIQQDHRSTREYGPLKEAAQRRMDMDCMGPEAYAERERQREQDRRDKEYREAALRRETDLRDQMERDHRYHQERERDKERQRERGREQAQREHERDQVERDNRTAADRRRNESQPVQSGLSPTLTGWRGASLRSTP
ncbi:hypothetical protein LJR118_004473 [Acidovorax sp. LjRoot118]|uniref:hypothetical protein n=1 Tax=Acidovorax sp. LjRoot118 TaxID=3342256 RepID=UPI003ED0C71A